MSFGERAQTPTRVSRAVRSWITTVEPLRVMRRWSLNSPRVRVTVSREVPIIWPICSWVRVIRTRAASLASRPLAAPSSRNRARRAAAQNENALGILLLDEKHGAMRIGGRVLDGLKRFQRRRRKITEEAGSPQRAGVALLDRLKSVWRMHGVHHLSGASAPLA